MYNQPSLGLKLLSSRSNSDLGKIEATGQGVVVMLDLEFQTPCRPCSCSYRFCAQDHTLFGIPLGFPAQLSPACLCALEGVQSCYIADIASLHPAVHAGARKGLYNIRHASRQSLESAVQQYTEQLP